MPDSHEPSLRVPLPRLKPTALPDPPAQAGGVLLPVALARAAIQPLHFLLAQLWLGAAPLADLLGVQELFGASRASGGAAPRVAPEPDCGAQPGHSQK